MAQGLKGLLEKHMERKSFKESGNSKTEKFREERAIKPLPKEKILKSKYLTFVDKKVMEVLKIV